MMIKIATMAPLTADSPFLQIAAASSSGFSGSSVSAMQLSRFFEAFLKMLLRRKAPETMLKMRWAVNIAQYTATSLRRLMDTLIKLGKVLGRCEKQWECGFFLTDPKMEMRARRMYMMTWTTSVGLPASVNKRQVKHKG